MVRKQNERTLLLQYRIIPLSLPTNSILSYFSTPCPLSSRLGAFLSPETFSHKFFPKFFPIRPRRLFAVFLVRKIMGVEGSCRSANGGGCPFLHAHHIANRHFIRLLSRVRLLCSLLLRHSFACYSLSFALLEFSYSLSFPAPIVANFQPIRAKRGKNRAKVNIYLIVFVLPSYFRRQQTAKT